jgi:hypothetical protein
VTHLSPDPLTVVRTLLMTAAPTQPCDKPCAARPPGASLVQLAKSSNLAAILTAQTSGALLSFLGCSLDPPPFASAIKCHQKNTSNSARSSVGSLASPRATPRLGGVCVSCQHLPCSFVLTRPARSRPSIGGQSPTPAPRQLPWSPPRGWCPRVR